MPKINVLSILAREFDSNYQLLLNRINQRQYKQLIRNKIAKRTKIVSDLFYSHKALNSGASNDLPYQTLVLIGELLGHPVHQKVIKKIIHTNILKSKGEFLKLDDPYQQGKIRRTLRNHQFEACDDINTTHAA